MILKTNLLINTLLAAAPAKEAMPEQPIWLQIVPLLLMFAAIWFLLIRPANKRRKEQENMISSLQKGDEVLTGGGILGRICSIDSNGIVSLEIADKVRIRILKSQIAGRYNPDNIGQNNNEKKADEASSADKK